MAINFSLYRTDGNLDSRFASTDSGGGGGDNPSPSINGLTYAGAFRVPQGAYGGVSFSGNSFVNAQYQVMAFNPVGSSMFLGGSPIGNGDGVKTIGEITIPELVISEDVNNLNVAGVLQNPIDPSNGGFDALKADGSVPSAEARGVLGGIYVVGNKLYGTSWSYYDASGSNGARSHWTCDLDLTNWDGLHTVGTPVTNVSANGGYVGGYLLEVPSQYQSDIGFSLMSGRVGGPIVSRASLGPALWGFDESTFDYGNPATAEAFLTYPEPSILGGYSDEESLYFNRGTGIKGAIWPTNSDSVLFFGNHGLGIEFNSDGTPKPSTQASEYGYGTSNKTEAKSAAEIAATGESYQCGYHTITNAEAQSGIACVYDPVDSSLTTHDYGFEFGKGGSQYGFGTDDWTEARTTEWLQANSPSGYQCGPTFMNATSIAEGDSCKYVGPAGSTAKGGSSYPSLYQVWQYPAQDLIDIKAGTKTYNEVIPTVFNLDLPFIDPTRRKQVAATAYDSSANRIYLLQSFGDNKWPVIHAFDVTV